MDEESLAKRLEAAVGSTQVGLGATIRPTLDTLAADVGTEDTIAGESLAPARKLPHITVDVPGSLAGPPITSGDADLEVRSLIGEGGMGRVFLARQHSLDRDVAVKTIRDSADGSIRQALVFEGVITGQLEHPAIVPVHALGLDQSGRPAMVMKRIEGVSWDELIANPEHDGWESWEGDRDDRLPGHLQILSQVCNAVHFAHSRGIVHRDLKPENILIGRFGDIYVADWGIAARIGVADDQRLCGTPGYMAPEMVRGQSVDARTDVYLLGAILHQVLTGTHRHDAPTGVAALAQALLSEPHEYDDDVPSSLADLANRACSLDPEARPDTAMAFRDALHDYDEHRQSIRLANEAMERLVSLRELEHDAIDQEQRRIVDRLGAEARFGFEQALESWKENPKAIDGLAQLDALLDERGRRRAELERIAHEHDPRIGERQRRLGLTLLALFGVSIGAIAFIFTAAPTVYEVLFFGSLVTLTTFVALFVMRKKLMKNTYGRQTVALLVIGASVMLIPRIADVWGDFTPASAFTRDSFSIGAIAAGASVTVLPAMRWLALCVLGGGVGIILFPPHCLQIFSSAIAVGLVATAIAARNRPDVD